MRGPSRAIASQGRLRTCFGKLKKTLRGGKANAGAMRSFCRWWLASSPCRSCSLMPRNVSQRSRRYCVLCALCFLRCGAGGGGRRQVFTHYSWFIYFLHRPEESPFLLMPAATRRSRSVDRLLHPDRYEKVVARSLHRQYDCRTLVVARCRWHSCDACRCKLAQAACCSCLLIVLQELRECTTW